jgi:sugar fermentation stimulation protein A
MKFSDLVPAAFIRRNNRFTAGIRLESGKVSTAFIPTTGRLTGVLIPGCKVWMAPAELGSGRKTPYSLVLVELERGGMCCVNAINANRLFDEAARSGGLSAFQYRQIQNEVPFGSSRLDFKLTEGEQVCWVEVKSVTYAADSCGMFPDAPTARGAKHLLELAKLTERGYRASVVFIAQREDVNRFKPFEKVDPNFAQTLRQVCTQGVEIHAYNCIVSTESIAIKDEIPFEIP